MTSMQSLNKSAHGHVRVDPGTARQACADQRLMPVVLSEFRRLCIDYPILLTKNGETGAFVAVALMGFEDGENLFWEEDGLTAAYTPLNIRRQPFFVGANDTKRDVGGFDYLVCIDMHNAAVSATHGEALFDGAGQATGFLQDIQTILAELVEGETQTRLFVDTLLEMKLVTALSLDITLADGTKRRVKGMYSVDEDRLQRLEPEAVAALHGRGYLGAIYTMIASVGQVYALIRKKNARLSATSLWQHDAG